ncbi:cytochrome c [Longimicrobium sp.]|uniref:c-type cytochrome n=1 Tax=Longimicrobium sp. TaxID=2029185 RepID=UPI002CEDB3A1|nr:cytochrome c [Longimicrobium sp.]HSU15570.1 cytochrome c [Longimicrobium sp.]
MTTAKLLALASLAASLGMGACTDWAGYDIDVAGGKIPQLANMRRSVIPDPYAMPRLPAPGAVASNSPMGDVPAHFGSDKLDSAAATFRNPYSGGATEAVLRVGQTKFQNNCYVCHGPEGAGNGPIVQLAKGADGKTYSRFPGAPAINGAITAGRSDGYIYAVITAGRGLMPPYGPRLTETDRWAVVEYVRTLQQRAGAAPQRGGPAPAGPAAVTGAPNPGTAGPAGPTPATAPATPAPGTTPAAATQAPAPSPAPAPARP